MELITGLFIAKLLAFKQYIMNGYVYVITLTKRYK